MPLDPKTKALIEQRFVHEEEERARRRRYYRKVFLAGFPAGCCGSALYGLLRCHAIPKGPPGAIISLVSALLGIVWFVCLLKYLGGSPGPVTFAGDVDMRRRLNPWKDALDNLKEDANMGEAIALLAGPTLAYMASLFAAEIFKSIV